jgi:hypothetical protein
MIEPLGLTLPTLDKNANVSRLPRTQLLVMNRIKIDAAGNVKYTITNKYIIQKELHMLTH